MTAAATDLFRGMVVPPPGEWVQQALCAQTDPDAFHPEKGASNTAAKKICGRCQVQRPCLRWAVGNNELSGIFGGLSPRERRDLTVELVDAMPPVVLVDAERIPLGRPLPLAVVPTVRPRVIPQPRPVPEEPESVTPAAPAKKTRARVAECGSTGGYSRHKRLKEPPCDACRAATAEYQRAWFQRKQQEKPAAAKPAVRIMWLLPPAPGGTRTEYAIDDGHGKLIPIHPNAAADLAQAGELILSRIVTDWVEITGGAS